MLSLNSLSYKLNTVVPFFPPSYLLICMHLLGLYSFSWLVPRIPFSNILTLILFRSHSPWSFFTMWLNWGVNSCTSLVLLFLKADGFSVYHICITWPICYYILEGFLVYFYWFRSYKLTSMNYSILEKKSIFSLGNLALDSKRGCLNTNGISTPFMWIQWC